MVVSKDSFVFTLLEPYRRANITCQETNQGKLLVSTELNSRRISYTSTYLNLSNQGINMDGVIPDVKVFELFCS